MANEDCRVYAKIDIENAKHNLALIRSRIGDKPEIMAIVKENAYGHGAVALSRLYNENGVYHFGVSSLDEAQELRSAGIEGEILVLGRLSPESAADVAEYGVTCMFSSFEEAREFSKAAEKLGKGTVIKAHIKIDTGFSRYGFYLHGEDDVPAAAEEIKRIKSLGNIKINGIMTHFADADNSASGFTDRQFSTFSKLLGALKAENVDCGLRHCANSSCILTRPETHLDMVRAGIALYGLAPSDDAAFSGIDLRPVMGLYTRVTQITKLREGDRVSYGGRFKADSPRTVATLGIGYGDGYSRLLSNRDSVVINGRRYPVVGSICMNACMADVTGGDGIKVGDEVEIFGANKPVSELSKIMGTIDYEIICMISERVKRI
ncbi:MAG: alanine racemase [Clostridia bacterium]|nr:alanine racemase [Clostridia bacterium]